MKSIGLDSRMLGHTGIGTYLQGLISHLKPDMLPVSELMLYGLPHGSFKNQNFSAPIYSLREQAAYPSLLAGKDLWHAPHYNIPYFKGKAKLVVTVHDLIHWIFRKNFLTLPQILYAKIFFERVVKTADHIIAVSTQTKEDLIAYFGADEKKITVVYESVHSDFQPEPEPGEGERLRRYQLPQNYFLYVGMIKAHKNVHQLVRIYRELRRKGEIKSGLVLIGRADPEYADFHREMRHECAGLIHIERVEKGDLPAFYRQALALVHPSLYEGFGLTILEAMASGTPVIAARAGSIPEIAGHAAMLIPPYEERPWLDALPFIESNEKRRKQLRESGLIHVKRFSWDFTAQKTAEIYRKVLG